MRVFVALAAVALLTGCGSSPEPIADEESEDTSMEAVAADAMAAADAAAATGDAPIDEEKGGETYSEYDARRDSYAGSRGTYAGDGCTEDCGGHDAGYQWAEARGITDPDSCGGKSWSFEEGCRAYAEEQAGGDE